MTISGFSYIRNGFKYQYPFLQSIQTLLLFCDEVVVAVGQSTDGTWEALGELQKNNPQLQLIDTVWDEKLRQSGKVFAQQANIALRACTGDWIFHLQADELIHQNDIPLIKKTIADIHNNLNINGLLLDFLHFTAIINIWTRAVGDTRAKFGLYAISSKFFLTKIRKAFANTQAGKIMKMAIKV